MPSLEEALGRLLARLDDHDIPYMIVGGIALEGLGVPRATLAIDVQIRVPEPPRRHRGLLPGPLRRGAHAG